MPGRIIVTILFVFLVTFGSISAQAVEKKTTASAVIILPFDAGAAGKYSYLKESLRNMLTTRLAVKDGIRILDDSLSPKQSAEVKAEVNGLKKQGPPPALFARLHASYIVTGILSSRADGLDLHLIFYSAAGAKNPMKFTMTAENEEKILPALDRLAADIGDKVAGAPGAHEVETVVQKDTGKQQTMATSGPMAAFRTPHPERPYKTGLYAGGSIVGAENGGMQVLSKGVRKSLPLSLTMVAMAVGDLDGDGTKEIVLAQDGELRIYHLSEGRFTQIAKASIPANLKINALNLADLDKSGRMEIYISATDAKTVSSLVAAWDQKHGLQILHKDVHWYLRPMEIPGEGMVLVGQEKGLDDNILVTPGIYKLTLQRGSDVPQRGRQLSLPKSVNLFDFTLADLNGDGAVETLVIDGNEKLSVYDQAGTPLWVSTENFGGSMNYLGPRWTNPALQENRIYVPTRILVADMNHDKKKEILVARNQRGTSSYNYFKNSRWYKGGFISCLTWTGSAMAELWHTEMLDGMIVDYSFQPGPSLAGVGTGGRVGENPAEQKMGTATLFVGHVPESGFLDSLLPSSNETGLLAYSIEFANKKSE